MCGDTHGNGNHIRHLFATALRNECQAIFVLGDFGYWEHGREGVEFLDRVNDRAAEVDTEIYFLDGNHDKTGLLLERYGDRRDDEGFMLVRDHIHYAPRGHRWTWAGVRFIALGGAYSTDKQWRLDRERKTGKPGSLWFPEEEMSDEDMAAVLADGTPVDVMLAHDKPRASNPGWNREDLPECWPNQDRLQRAVAALRPRLYLHGHLHYRYKDHIRIDGHTWCQVQALTPDPDAAEPGYLRGDSRVVLDVANVLVLPAD